MLDQTISTQVLIGVAMSYVLQWLKVQKWFPLFTEGMSKYGKVIISGVVAAGSALGIHFGYDPTLGSLTITGLTLAHVWAGILAFGYSFVAQHASYELLIHPSNGK